jgi:hypothetical protein
VRNFLKKRNLFPKKSSTPGATRWHTIKKVLRLRYGEFLGEEFESVSGHSGHGGRSFAEEDVHKTVWSTYMTNNEHNLVEEKKSATKDAHDHTEIMPIAIV